MKLLKLAPAILGAVVFVLIVAGYAHSSQMRFVMIPEPPACSLLPVFTSLATDPVKPGGLTGQEIQALLSQGWTDNYVDGTQSNIRVQFRKSDGALEWRCGTLHDGTRILRSPADPTLGTLSACGNPIYLDEDLLLRH